MQDFEQLTRLESTAYKVWSSIRLLVVVEAVAIRLVCRDNSRLDLQVGFDLCLDLSANFWPEWVAVAHLTAYHAHICLHCLE